MVYDTNTAKVMNILACGKCLGKKKDLDTEGMRECENCEKFLWDIDERYESKKKTCENLKEANRKLKKELEQLKNHIAYMPDGPGYLETKKEFEDKIENQTA